MKLITWPIVRIGRAILYDIYRIDDTDRKRNKKNCKAEGKERLAIY